MRDGYLAVGTELSPGEAAQPTPMTNSREGSTIIPILYMRRLRPRKGQELSKIEPRTFILWPLLWPPNPSQEGCSHTRVPGAGGDHRGLYLSMSAYPTWGLAAMKPHRVYQL